MTLPRDGTAGVSAPGSASPPPPATPSRPPLGRNVIALAAVALLTDLSSDMIYPLLPLFLSGVLGASAAFIGLIEGTADSVSALLKLVSGWWSDRVGKRKPLVVLGYTLATIARPLVGLATTAPQVLGIRVTDRVGKGIRNAPRDALIADSVDPMVRGRAFGVHRAADHFGAVIGPLVAFGLLAAGLSLRSVFLLAAVPGALAVAVLVLGVRDVARRGALRGGLDLGQPLGRRFWTYLGVLFLFTLGNSTDAFLLLRAAQLGVPAAMVPLLWALLHVVKAASSTPGGVLSDRIGRAPLIIGGWLLYGLVYLGLAAADAAWQVWALFLVYGIYFGMTEGVERALVADLVPEARRGTAFGWYNLAIAVGALPASIIFGAIWDAAGAPAAFTFGAAMAMAASLGLAIVSRAAPPRNGTAIAG